MLRNAHAGRLRPRSRPWIQAFVVALSATVGPAQLQFLEGAQPLSLSSAVRGIAESADFDGDGTRDVWVNTTGGLTASFGVGRFGLGSAGVSVDAIAALEDHAPFASSALFKASSGKLERWTFADGTVLVTSQIGVWNAVSDVRAWSHPQASFGFVVPRDGAQQTCYPRLHWPNGDIYVAYTAPVHENITGGWVLCDLADDKQPEIIYYDSSERSIVAKLLDASASMSVPLELTGSVELHVLRHGVGGPEQLLLSSWDGESARLHLMGSASFDAGVPVAGAAIAGLTTGDVDQDGFADVVFVADGVVSVLLYEASADPLSGSVAQVSTGLAVGRVALSVADFDQDGDVDIHGIDDESEILLLNRLKLESDAIAELDEIKALSPAAPFGAGPLAGPPASFLDVSLRLDRPPGLDEFGADTVDVRVWSGTSFELADSEVDPAALAAWEVTWDDPWPVGQSLEIPVPGWDLFWGTQGLFFIEIRMRNTATAAVDQVLPTTWYAGLQDPATMPSQWASLVDAGVPGSTVTVTGSGRTGKYVPGIVRTSGRPRPTALYPHSGPGMPTEGTLVPPLR